MPTRIIKTPSVYSKLLAEFIGTFFLTLTISLVVQNIAYTQSTMIHPGLVIGLVLTSLIYSLGQYSQAHFNPTVTFAIAVCFKQNNNWADKMLLNKKLALMYVVIQIGAAIAAGLMSIYLTPVVKPDQLVIDYMPFAKPISDSVDHMFKAWVAELLWSFLLVVVILCVGFPSQKSQKGNQFYGLAIGMIVTGGIVCLGAVSGAAFNPAVATGLATAYCVAHPEREFNNPCGWITMKYLWIYYTACPLGAALATLANAILMSTQDQETDYVPEKEMDVGDLSARSNTASSISTTTPSPTASASSAGGGCVVTCNNENGEDDDRSTLLRRKRPCAADDECIEDDKCKEMEEMIVSSSRLNNKPKNNKICDVPGLGKVIQVNTNSSSSSKDK